MTLSDDIMARIDTFADDVYQIEYNLAEVSVNNYFFKYLLYFYLRVLSKTFL